MPRPWQICVTVRGLNLSRFLRYAGENGIRLSKVRRLGAKQLKALVPEEQLPQLHEAAVRGGWKIEIGRRSGPGLWLEQLRERWLLAVSVLLILLAAACLSQVVWRVDIENGGPYTADIRQALKAQGISPPMLRSRVDLGRLKETLEWRYPRVAWAECGWRGTALVIRLTQGNIPRDDPAGEGTWDIVAERDGIVCTVAAAAGTPVVEPGDIVRAGDILIKGEERTFDGQVKAVAAQGSVIARVWKGAAVRMSVREVETVYTGGVQSVWTVRTPWFDLWPMDACPYQQYDTAVSETRISGIFLPAVLHRESRMEARFTSEVRSAEAVRKEVAAAAVRKLREKIGPDESLIDIWENCSMIDAENIVSVAIGEMRMEIGRQVPAAGMAAPAEVCSDQPR